MSSAKADCEHLLKAVLPFAQKMLDSYGEFHPFGGAMRPDRELVQVAGHVGGEHPQATEVINFLKTAFVAAAREGQYIATAIVYDVRVGLPGTGEKSDAIAVALDHRDAYSVVVLFPYKIESAKAVMGTAFAQKGDAAIFLAN